MYIYNWLIKDKWNGFERDIVNEVIYQMKTFNPTNVINKEYDLSLSLS